MPVKRIAMVAHDERKKDLLAWIDRNIDALTNHELYGTGTTGGLIKEHFPQLNITPLKSGPLGGDQQLGSLICDEKLDMLFFLMDPMTPQPHDVDIKALLRLAVLYNIPAAYNISTADFLIRSPLFAGDYKPERKDYGKYLKRLA